MMKLEYKRIMDMKKKYVAKKLFLGGGGGTMEPVGENRQQSKVGRDYF